MIPGIFLWTLYRQRWSLLAWGVAFLALAITMSSLYPSIANMSDLQQLLEEYPAGLKAVFGLEGFDFSNPASYLKHELFALFVPALMLIFTIASGVGAVSVEESRKTLDLILSLPVRRTAYIVQKFASSAALTVMLSCTLFIGIWAAALILDLNLNLANIAAGCLMVGALGIFGLALGMGLSAALGHSGASLGIAVVVVASAYLLHTIAPLVGWLEPYQKLSPYYYYAVSDPLLKGVNWTHLLVLLGLSAAILALGIWRFEHRDIRS